MQIDSQLIKRCIRKEQSAQNELYKLCFSPLMNICMRYKNNYDSAGASLNSIFLKILTNLDSYDIDRSFYAWIKRIAVNLLIDEYRKRKRETENLSYLEDMDYKLNSHNNHSGEEKLDADYLLQLIKELPETSAKVFNLYAIDGYKHKEIADIMQISESTSKWHLHNARSILKAKLKVFNKEIEIDI